MVVCAFFENYALKIWKFENLFVSLQLIWNQEQGANYLSDDNT